MLTHFDYCCEESTSETAQVQAYWACTLRGEHHRLPISLLDVLRQTVLCIPDPTVSRKRRINTRH